MLGKFVKFSLQFKRELNQFTGSKNQKQIVSLVDINKYILQIK
jgi:hypothetical protein